MLDVIDTIKQEIEAYRLGAIELRRHAEVSRESVIKFLELADKEDTLRIQHEKALLVLEHEYARQQPVSDHDKVS